MKSTYDLALEVEYALRPPSIPVWPCFAIEQPKVFGIPIVSITRYEPEWKDEKSGNRWGSFIYTIVRHWDRHAFFQEIEVTEQWSDCNGDPIGLNNYDEKELGSFYVRRESPNAGCILPIT